MVLLLMAALLGILVLLASLSTPAPPEPLAPEGVDVVKADPPPIPVDGGDERADPVADPSKGSSGPKSSSGGGGGSGGPSVVREHIHVHDYRWTFLNHWLMFAMALAVVLATRLGIRRFPALIAIGLITAVWAIPTAVEFVDASQYPAVPGEPDRFEEDGVRHIETRDRHLHPVNVNVPLLVLGLGVGATSVAAVRRIRPPRSTSRVASESI